MQQGEWQILGSTPLLTYPQLRVALEQVSKPDGQVVEWPIVETGDYVNAVVFNPEGEVLILEGYKHGVRRQSWQVINAYLEPGSSPVTTVEEALQKKAGYESKEWHYLGSFVVDANCRVGTGHFFVAFDALPVDVERDLGVNGECRARWVAPEELQYALVDGRINVVTSAVNVMLAFLMLKRLNRGEAC